MTQQPASRFLSITTSNSNSICNSNTIAVQWRRQNYVVSRSRRVQGVHQPASVVRLPPQSVSHARWGSSVGAVATMWVSSGRLIVAPFSSAHTSTRAPLIVPPSTLTPLLPTPLWRPQWLVRKPRLALSACNNSNRAKQISLSSRRSASCFHDSTVFACRQLTFLELTALGSVFLIS